MEELGICGHTRGLVSTLVLMDSWINATMMLLLLFYPVVSTLVLMDSWINALLDDEQIGTLLMFQPLF